MSVNRIRSQHGEDVCEFVWLALAAYDESQATRQNEAGWQRRKNEPSRAVLSAISEIASYVEAFVVESLITHAEIVSGATTDPIPKIVLESVSKLVEGSWAGRRTFITRWLNEDLSGADWWKRWMGFVEARNAWAHGQGNLTERQRASQEVKANIKLCGLTLSGSLVSGGADDVRQCVRSAVEVVDWIDERVRRS